MASITIRKTIPTYTSEKQSYDLKLEAVAASDMSKAVFVFKHGLAPLPAPGVQAPAGAPMDWFVCIADPVDLEEYPENTPDMANSNPYFRKDSVTLRFRSVLEMEDCWHYISEDVQGLVDALNSAMEEGSSEEVSFS